MEEMEGLKQSLSSYVQVVMPHLTKQLYFASQIIKTTMKDFHHAKMANIPLSHCETCVPCKSMCPLVLNMKEIFEEISICFLENLAALAAVAQ